MKMKDYCSHTSTYQPGKGTMQLSKNLTKNIIPHKQSMTTVYHAKQSPMKAPHKAKKMHAKS